jgi:cytoskeleton protein RodZ
MAERKSLEPSFARLDELEQWEAARSSMRTVARGAPATLTGSPMTAGALHARSPARWRHGSGSAAPDAFPAESFAAGSLSAESSFTDSFPSGSFPADTSLSNIHKPGELRADRQEKAPAHEAVREPRLRQQSEASGIAPPPDRVVPNGIMVFPPAMSLPQEEASGPASDSVPVAPRPSPAANTLPPPADASVPFTAASPTAAVVATRTAPEKLPAASPAQPAAPISTPVAIVPPVAHPVPESLGPASDLPSGAADLPEVAHSLRVTAVAVDIAAGPGHELRSAREARGFDLAMLASLTRLSRRTLEDLENNRFERIPSIYVRGYLRTVARELEVGADPWIQSYEALGYVEPVLKASLQQPRSAPVRHSLKKSGFALVILVSLVLAAALTSLFYAHEGEPRRVLDSMSQWSGQMTSVLQTWVSALRSQDAANATLDGWPGTEGSAEEANDLGLLSAGGPDGAALAPDAFMLPEVAFVPVVPDTADMAVTTPLTEDSSGRPLTSALSVGEPSTSAGARASAASGLPGAVVPPAAAASMTPPPGSRLASPAPAAAIPPADLALATPPTLASPPVPVTRPESPEPIALAPGEGLLRFSIREETWLEVRNSAGEVALTGILLPGEQRSLRVTMPSRIVLGNAPGVDFSINGEVVDLTPHTRNDRTARFNVNLP